MTEAESKILETLLELESTVAHMAQTQPKPDLGPIFTTLDELAAQLPLDADPDLRHYLQRKSYQKARLHLQGRSAENQPGNCGR